jgi:hypothetical protein
MTIHTLKELRKALKDFPDDMLIAFSPYLESRPCERKELEHVFAEGNVIIFSLD